VPSSLGPRRPKKQLCGRGGGGKGMADEGSGWPEAVANLSR
jgi:hypothetical protein